MKTLKRSIFLLLALTILSFVVPSIQAQDLMVENGKIVLPSTIIRGRYDDIIARQEIVRMEFVQEVEYSPYEVEDVTVQTTGDGFVELIFPTFSDRFKTPQSQHRVLAFVRGDKEMELYETLGPDAFFALVLKSDEELIKAKVLKKSVGGRKTPVLILVKTRSLLVST